MSNKLVYVQAQKCSDLLAPTSSIINQEQCIKLKPIKITPKVYMFKSEKSEERNYNKYEIQESIQQ